MGRLNKEALVKFLMSKHQEDFGKNITPIKLQKALYFLYAFFGGHTRILNLDPESVKVDESLFSASFEAWAYGPVDRDVYFRFKNGYLNYEHFDKEQFLSQIDEFTKGYLLDMTDRIFNTSDFGLVELSHNDECWKKYFNRETPQESQLILNEDILNEYSHKVA